MLVLVLVVMACLLRCHGFSLACYLQVRLFLLRLNLLGTAALPRSQLQRGACTSKLPVRALALT